MATRRKASPRWPVLSPQARVQTVYRVIRSRFAKTHRQAVGLYRALRKRQERPVTARDVPRRLSPHLRLQGRRLEARKPRKRAKPKPAAPPPPLPSGRLAHWQSSTESSALDIKDNRTPLRVQIDIQAPSNIGKRALRAAVDQWAVTGKAPRGVKVTTIHWRGKSAKGDAIEQQRQALNLPAWLSASGMDFTGGDR